MLPLDCKASLISLLVLLVKSYEKVSVKVLKGFKISATFLFNCMQQIHRILDSAVVSDDPYNLFVTLLQQSNGDS